VVIVYPLYKLSEEMEQKAKSRRFPELTEWQDILLGY
jgi:hypothetical protein